MKASMIREHKKRMKEVRKKEKTKRNEIIRRATAVRLAKEQEARYNKIVNEWKKSKNYVPDGVTVVDKL